MKFSNFLISNFKICLIGNNNSDVLNLDDWVPQHASPVTPSRHQLNSTTINETASMRIWTNMLEELRIQNRIINQNSSAQMKELRIQNDHLKEQVS